MIGGGYAGMAAAVELAAAGVAITVVEVSRTLGGRARAIEIEDAIVDNGQHLLVGAYRETLRLMVKVGVDPGARLLRLPLSMEFPGRMRLVAPKLPAPLHLLCALLFARGLKANEKWQAIRFMRTLEQQGFKLRKDQPLAELLDQHHQGAVVRHYLWEPLCTAALNTPAKRASAQIFAHVLRDTLAADRSASDFLLLLTDLSQLFPEPAAAYIERCGGRVLRSTRVERLRRDADQWWLDNDGPYDQVVLAVAPHQVARIVGNVPQLEYLIAQLARFEWEPIVTAYLAYPAHVRLSQPLIAFADAHVQWLFDRGQSGGPAGLLAAVISARGRHLDLDHDSLLAHIRIEIASVIGKLHAPRWQRVITEKRATFSCTPNLSRPEARTPLPGLWLAGDYVASDYPATIEGAVRSGVAAARHIMASPQPAV